MSGLIDAATGLRFGQGLQFEEEIGTATLQIKPTATLAEVLASDGSELLASDTSAIVTAS